MERFISTKLYRLLRKASQKGIDMDARVLTKEQDKFTALLLANPAPDKAAYRSILLNTRVKLAGLTGVSGKKMRQPVCTTFSN